MLSSPLGRPSLASQCPGTWCDVSTSGRAEGLKGMNDVFYVHSPSLSLSHPFHPLLSVVRTSPSHVAPTPPLPGSCRPHPLSASSPGSCSLIQLGRCNLLKKKCHNVVITPVGDLARVAVVGGGLVGRRPTLTAEGSGLEGPFFWIFTHSLGLHFGAHRVQSLDLSSSRSRDLETEAWND